MDPLKHLNALEPTKKAFECSQQPREQRQAFAPESAEVAGEEETGQDDENSQPEQQHQDMWAWDTPRRRVTTFEKLTTLAESPSSPCRFGAYGLRRQGIPPRGLQRQDTTIWPAEEKIPQPYGMLRGKHFRPALCSRKHFRQLTHIGLRHRASKHSTDNFQGVVSSFGN